MRSDGNPGQTGDRENPSLVPDISCPFSRVELDPRNPSWPAVFNPHQKAGHKTAPDRDAKLQKVLAMQEPSTQDYADIGDPHQGGVGMPVLGGKAEHVSTAIVGPGLGPL